MATRRAVSFALQSPAFGHDVGQTGLRLLQTKGGGIDEPGLCALRQQRQIVQAVTQGQRHSEGADLGQYLVLTVAVKALVFAPNSSIVFAARGMHACTNPAH